MAVGTVYPRWASLRHGGISPAQPRWQRNNETILTIKEAPKVKTKEGRDCALQTIQPLLSRGLSISMSKAKKKTSVPNPKLQNWSRQHPTIRSSKPSSGKPRSSSQSIKASARALANLRAETTAATTKRPMRAVYQPGTVSGINTSKKKLSIISKVKAEAATMRAWKSLGPAVCITVSNVIRITSARINTRSNTDLTYAPWTKESTNIHMSKRFQMRKLNPKPLSKS